MRNKQLIYKNIDVKIAYKLNAKEVQCKCLNPLCHYTIMDNLLLDLWGFFREKWDKPVKITSGYRCQSHNSSAGVRGVAKSKHTMGSALDLQLPSENKEEFIALAKKIFPYVKDDYATFIHVDVRG